MLRKGGTPAPGGDEDEPDDLVFDEALKVALNNATINLPIPKLFQNRGKYDYLKSFRRTDIKERNEKNGGPSSRRTKKKATRSLKTYAHTVGVWLPPIEVPNQNQKPKQKK